MPRMEIHPILHPIRSLKEVSVHVGIVTIGIVIALSFEGCLEWAHNRALVEEARQNLRNEIANNQKDVQLVLKSLETAKPRFSRAIELLGNSSSIPDHDGEMTSLFNPNGQNALSYGFTLAWLNTASYQTAQVSGAFALMEYDEVRRFAEIYDPQALFHRAQDSASTGVRTVVMLGPSVLANPTPAEIDDMERQLRLALGGLLEVERWASILNQRYAAALKGMQ
jgi:hypothetical protein